ncbi:MAG: NAD(P)/FAD-dependent oxidoreductase [Deltaproteobacteria bacterium]
MQHSLSPETYDVIVIGGGPSGIQTSMLLAEKGLRTVLIDKNTEIGKDVVCSGVISKEAFSRYDLPESAILASLGKADLYSPFGTFIPYCHPEETVVVVDRHKFDSELAKAAARKGVAIRLNTKVSSLDVNGDCVSAELRTASGVSRIRARTAVIATGVSFHLQSALGMGRPEKIIKGIQVEVRAEEVGRLRIYWGNEISAGFFGWAIPLSDGRTRVGVMTEEDPINGLNHILSRIGPYRNICSETGKVKRRGIAFGTISRSYSDRVVAVGEASGLVKTTTGGGIYYGLISAEMASDTISEAFATGDFSAGTLSAYEKLWKKSLGREIAFGKRFHGFYSRLKDNSIEALFDAAKKDNLLHYISRNGKFDWHKNAVVKILRSPNLRRVLLWEGINSVKANISY